MTKGTKEVVPLKRVRADQGIQVRKHMRPDVVNEYAEAMKNGDKFPPIVCFDTGKMLAVADGFHRLEAMHKNGDKEAEIEIRQGSLLDALIYAASCNSTHGIQRTREDKINAVTMLLQKPEIAAQSNRQIAEMANVSDPFVGTVRAMVETSTANVSSSTPATRVGKDKKARKVPAKKNRQPGCEPAEVKNPADPKQGEPTFDLRQFNTDVGTVTRHLDRLARDFGLVHPRSNTVKETLEHKGIRRKLEEAAADTVAWRTQLTKDKKNAAKVSNT